MDGRRLPWEDLQFFLATARGGSLAAAASTLSVSSATVHRRLAALERHLGVGLFVRSPRGYALTVAGHELLAHVRAADIELLAAERRLGGRDQQLEGEIRLSTVDDLAVSVLGGVLRDFRSAHPLIRFDVSVDSGPADLAQRHADVAIRLGSRPRDGDLIARRICTVAIAMYAGARYIEHHGRPRGPSAWSDHAIVRGDEARAALSMERYISQFTADSAAVVRSDSMLARWAAVRDGIGIGLLPCFIADDTAGLVRIGQIVPEASAELWILVHADLRRNARMRSFVEFAHHALAAMQSRFEGRA